MKTFFLFVSIVVFLVSYFFHGHGSNKITRVYPASKKVSGHMFQMFNENDDIKNISPLVTLILENIDDKDLEDTKPLCVAMSRDLISRGGVHLIDDYECVLEEVLQKYIPKFQRLHLTKIRCQFNRLGLQCTYRPLQDMTSPLSLSH